LQGTITTGSPRPLHLLATERHTGLSNTFQHGRSKLYDRKGELKARLTTSQHTHHSLKAGRRGSEATQKRHCVSNRFCRNRPGKQKPERAAGAAKENATLEHEMAVATQRVLLIPEFCPGGQRLSCGPTLSTNQMRPWD